MKSSIRRVADPAPPRTRDPSPRNGLGLRARKKEQTRRLIYEAASQLFTERGFDAVTVAEIARLADVSEVTVFNYFTTKEDLAFGGMQFFEERIIAAVVARDRGESALSAVRRIVVDGIGHIADPATAATIARGAKIIAGSPALQSRQRDIVARYSEELARRLAEEAGVPSDSAEPWMAATALLAAHMAIVARTHASIRAGHRGRRLVAEVRTYADAVFSLLETGLGDFAIRGEDPA